MEQQAVAIGIAAPNNRVQGSGSSQLQRSADFLLCLALCALCRDQAASCLLPIGIRCYE